MTRKEFQQQVASQYARMYRVAYTLTSDEDEACDIVQDTLMKLWDKRSKLDDVKNLPACCMGALRNQFVDSRRKLCLNPVKRPVSEADEAVSDETMRAVEAGSSMELVNRIIQELPENQSLVIKLSCISDCSNEEIAAITGLSMANVRTLLSRGRKRLKELYIKYR